MSLCRALSLKMSVARTDVWIFFSGTSGLVTALSYVYSFRSGQRNEGPVSAVYGPWTRFVCWFFFILFFVTACFEGVLWLVCRVPEIVLKPVALAAMTLPGMSSSPLSAGKSSRWNAAPAEACTSITACDTQGSEGKDGRLPRKGR